MFIYKRHTLLYWGLFALAAVLYFVKVIEKLNFFSLLLYTLYFFVYAVIMGLVFNAIDSKKYHSMFKQFNEDANLLLLKERFMKRYQSVVPKLQAGLVKDYAYILRLKGEYSKALSCLLKIDINKLVSRKIRITTYEQYLTELAMNYIGLCDFEKANEALQNIYEFIVPSKNEVVRERAIETAIDLENIIKLLSGNFEEELGYFAYKVEDSTGKLLKIKYCFLYAKALLMAGKQEKAKKSLQYVLENSSELPYIKEQAQQALENCGNSQAILS